MKKFLKLLVLPLLACLPMTVFVSCGDDDDTPDVDLSISIEDATVVDDVIYVVKGETLEITAVNIKNNEPGCVWAQTSFRLTASRFLLSAMPQSAATPCKSYVTLLPRVRLWALPYSIMMLWWWRTHPIFLRARFRPR